MVAQSVKDSPAAALCGSAKEAASSVEERRRERGLFCGLVMVRFLSIERYL
jgi:hypothetical protein